MSVLEGWATLQMAAPDGARVELRHQPCCATDDHDTLKHLIIDGIGIGVLPAYLCAAELGDGRLGVPR